MKIEMKNSVSRRKAGFICTKSAKFGILRVEDWFRLKASLLE